MEDAVAEFDPLTMPSSEKRGEMSLEEFLRRDWDEMGDSLKYEWRDGFVEAGEENMNPKDLKILRSVIDRFGETKHHRDEGARIYPEMEIRSAAIKFYRKADLAAYTKEQIDNADQFTVPKFVIEIISTYDNAIHHEKKIQEYFESGVEAYWQILPDVSLVRIYHDWKTGTGCSGADICSAAPAFPDFEITANEIFG